MAEDIEDAKIAYRLKTIELIEEKLECPSLPINQITKFHFHINVNHKIEKDKKFVIVYVEVFIMSSEDNKTLGRIKVANAFEVDNLDSFIAKKTGIVKFPSSFETNLNSISISTTRGIMFSQFKGTNLHKAILPIIPPKSLKLVKTAG